MGMFDCISQIAGISEYFEVKNQVVSMSLQRGSCIHDNHLNTWISISVVCRKNVFSWISKFVDPLL